MQVQNKMQLRRRPRLPQAQVQQQGLTRRQVAAELPDGRRPRTPPTAGCPPTSTSPTTSPPSCRIRSAGSNGRGRLQLFGGQYAMRVWLDPYKLNAFSLTPSPTSIAAILAQNVQVSAGQIGGQPGPARGPGSSTPRSPPSPSCRRRAVPGASCCACTIRTAPRCACRDVARVELGAENYNVTSQVQRHARGGPGDQAGRPAPTRSTPPSAVKATGGQELSGDLPARHGQVT